MKLVAAILAAIIFVGLTLVLAIARGIDEGVRAPFPTFMNCPSGACPSPGHLKDGEILPGLS